MSAPETQEAVELNEFQQSLCKASPVITNSSTFTDPKTKLRSTKKTRHFEVYYPKQGQKLTFALQNVQTGQGIMTSKWGKLFMSLKLTDEQAQMLRNTVDAAILELIFQNRAKIFEGGREANVKSALELQLLYTGIVQDGKAKDENPDEKWPDEIIASVPSKKLKGGALEPLGVQIQDADGREYDWRMVQGRMKLCEVVVMVDKVAIDDKIKPNLSYRIIAVDDTAMPKIVTKRLGLKTKAPPSYTAASSAPLGDMHSDLSQSAVEEPRKKKKSKLNLTAEPVDFD